MISFCPAVRILETVYVSKIQYCNTFKKHTGPFPCSEGSKSSRKTVTVSFDAPRRRKATAALCEWCRGDASLDLQPFVMNPGSEVVLGLPPKHISVDLPPGAVAPLTVLQRYCPSPCDSHKCSLSFPACLAIKLCWSSLLVYMGVLICYMIISES